MYSILVMCILYAFSIFVTVDTDLANDVTDKADEKFTEEDFDEALGAPTEVLRMYQLYNTTTTLQPFYGSLSLTTRVSRYQKKHSPTHTYPDHQSSFITFLHLSTIQ